MVWFFEEESDESRAHQAYHEAPHKANLTHELIAAAASFEAAKAYEDHCAKNGKPDSHSTAKELMAAFVGFFIDREVETHGLDFLDKEQAKRDAQHKAHKALEPHWA